MDWSAEFPGLAHGTYLNSCAHGLLPRRARRAIEAHLDRWEGDPDWGAWGEEVEKARRAFARLIHARPEDVAVVANASQAVGAVMNAMKPGARHRIVTWEGDFPTSPFLAQRQRERGFAHTHVRDEGLRMGVDAWAKHVTPDTALAVVPAVASFSGYRLDVAAFAREAHARGALLLVDAFQAAGTYDLDVRALDCDFLVSGVYKWLLGPAGLAFLYARRDRQELLPTTAGWLGAEEPYSFDPMGPLASDARRFQSGGASVISCVGAAASLELIHEVGLDAIERRDRALVDRIVEGCRERKWDVLTPEDPRERASIVTFRVPDLEKALAALQRERVVVNPRLGGLRVSPHFYNRDADVDRLFDVLDEANRST